MTFTSPAGAALVAAEEENRRRGDETQGFLSASHGLLPVETPRLQLPERYRAWDEAAAALPQLWLDGRVRKELAQLPVLPTGVEDLADEDLWRASCVISMMAHAWVKSDPLDAPPPPPPLADPWIAIGKRLGRSTGYLSYHDLILYNWRLRDANLDDPIRVENLDLLVPTAGNTEEETFYLTQVEIAAQCAAAVTAAVQAQEAVLTKDNRALEDILLQCVAMLRHVAEVSFHKIDPNPRGATHVDQVVWANLVAPFAVPLAHGVAGPSGTAAPVFHVLDAIFGRNKFDTYLGKEVRHLRDWFSPNIVRFLEALDEVSVRDYIESSGDRLLQGAYASAFDAYAGEHGFLAVHRRKVYGFLEVAFKVGRQVTITGFKGAFKDRTWKEVDAELEHSRVERLLPASPQMAELAERRQAEDDPAGTVYHVGLAIDGTGMVYEPGDRCQVWVSNRPELVDRTLAALRATGDEMVPLTLPWREARAERGLEDATEIPLRQMLELAKLRPVPRDVGQALVKLTSSAKLDAVVDAYEEDRIEFWEAVSLAAEDGYDPKRLWESGIWQDEALSRILPPEPPRTYSIASAANEGAERGFPDRLDLTVGRVVYEAPTPTADDKIERRGAASGYLTSELDVGGADQVAVRVVHPPRFHLPRDVTRPIVMFAGGTGIAPFRGFLQERARTEGVGDAYLFLATRRSSLVPHREELEFLARDGHVNLRFALSDEDASLVFNPQSGKLEQTPGTRRLIGELMQEPETAALLWDMLRSPEEGGQGGAVFICGRAAFAHVVLEALRDVILAQLGSGASTDDADDYLYRAFAQGRIMQDTFTTFSPATAPGVLGGGRYDASEIAQHNDADNGYWMVVNGAVYDMTRFRNIHPGGARIVDAYCGMDATREWEVVGHDRNSEVDAMLSMYKMGSVRRLHFGSVWGVTLGAEGVEYLSLRDLFRSWVRLLYLTVEMQNAMRNDFGYLGRPLVAGHDGTTPSPLLMQLAANTHLRCLTSYYDGLLIGEDLQQLWAGAIGLCAPDEDVKRLRNEVDAVREAPLGRAVADYTEQMQRFHLRLSEGADDATWAKVMDLIALTQSAGEHFMVEAKECLRRGVRAFEEHEERTVEAAGRELMDSLLELPGIGARYHAEFMAGVERIGGGTPWMPTATG